MSVLLTINILFAILCLCMPISRITRYYGVFVTLFIIIPAFIKFLSLLNAGSSSCPEMIYGGQKWFSYAFDPSLSPTFSTEHDEMLFKFFLALNNAYLLNVLLLFIRNAERFKLKYKYTLYFTEFVLFCTFTIYILYFKYFTVLPYILPYLNN